MTGSCQNYCILNNSSSLQIRTSHDNNFSRVFLSRFSNFCLNTYVCGTCENCFGHEAVLSCTLNINSFEENGNPFLKPHKYFLSGPGICCESLILTDHREIWKLLISDTRHQWPYCIIFHDFNYGVRVSSENVAMENILRDFFSNMKLKRYGS